MRWLTHFCGDLTGEMTIPSGETDSTDDTVDTEDSTESPE